MDLSEVEVCADAAKGDQRGRRIIEGNERERLLASYAESGLTQKAFAQREGINYCTFVAWLGRARHSDSAPVASSPVRFREVAVKGGADRAHLEARLPDGTVVRGDDPRAIATLVALLRV